MIVNLLRVSGLAAASLASAAVAARPAARTLRTWAVPAVSAGALFRDSTTTLASSGSSPLSRQPAASSGLPLSIGSASALTQVRHKTFRKSLTKAFKKRKAWIDQLRAEGKPLPERSLPVLENKFWKVVGGMKIYKSVSPGSTHRRHPTRFHLHKGSAVWRLSYGKRSTGGRNRTGRITVRHRGGGHKKRVRQVDFMRKVPGAFEVVRLEYDPNRTAELCLLRHLATNEFSYIIRPAGIEPGAIVHSYREGIPEPAEGQQPIPRSQLIQPGNCLLLKDIPIGTQIHCMLCRSAGTSGQLLFTAQQGFAQVRLSSSEVRLIPVNATATIGVVGNEMHMHRNWGKAGARRRKGWRPIVRGIAMSAFAHPHGGGHKSKGNKAPRSIWGWKTKGWKTVRRKRWFVVTPKWKARKQ
ncbi:translation protein SH3-like domain-containing protein [Entophlyctis helioformis]|nr:translation protein SH3-like domain-containing protein [Entophlyctis helioformis]